MRLRLPRPGRGLCAELTCFHSTTCTHPAMAEFCRQGSARGQTACGTQRSKILASAPCTKQMLHQCCESTCFQSSTQACFLC